MAVYEAPSGAGIVNAGHRFRQEVKSPPAPQAVAREARDRRERREVDRVESHLVGPVSLVPPVSPFPPVAPDVQTIEVLLLRIDFSAAC